MTKTCYTDGDDDDDVRRQMQNKVKRFHHVHDFLLVFRCKKKRYGLISYCFRGKPQCWSRNANFPSSHV